MTNLQPNERQELQRQLDVLRRMNDALEHEILSVTEDRLSLQKSLAEHKRWLERLQAEQNVSHGALKSLHYDVHTWKQSYEHVLATKSWKITEPLRKFQAWWAKSKSEGFVRTVRSNLYDLWTDFDKPMAWLLEKKPAPQPQGTETLVVPDTVVPEVAHTAYLYSPVSFLPQDEYEKSKQAVSRMPYHPHITVVVRVEFLEEILLRRALNSIAEQTYPYWNVVIADASVSSEAMSRVVEDYNTQYPGKFTMLQNAGRSHITCQNAINSSQGAYACILNATDTLRIDALERMITAALEQPQLPDVVYADHAEFQGRGDTYSPVYKPDFSPELLLSHNYIGGFFLVKRQLATDLQPQKSLPGPAFQYDMLLRIAEHTTHITHVPRITWYAHRSYTFKHREAEWMKHALQEAFTRRGVPHSVSVHPKAEQLRTPLLMSAYAGTERRPKVTIIIPTKDRVDLLERCVSSIRAHTLYPNYDIVVIDNGSTDPGTLSYLQTLTKTDGVSVFRIQTDRFTFAGINNAAAAQVTSPYVLFLNNDTEILHGSWLNVMMDVFDLDKNIGVVGGKLLFPEGSPLDVQHAGMIVGRHRASLVKFRRNKEPGEQFYNVVMRNCSAVSGACLLTKRELFDELGGFTEDPFAVDFCDSDYCLKVIQSGSRVVFTPFAEIRHYESATRGNNEGRGATLNPEEAAAYEAKWGAYQDPYYNPNFSRYIQELAFEVRPHAETAIL